MKSLVFNNGDTMQAVGLGTWKATGDEVKFAVREAIYAGYRHIDTAAIYKNEADIGEALAELFDEGVITRDEVFVTSKLWNNAHEPEHVIPALKESLKKLQLDYLDLYLIHWPVAFRHDTEYPSSSEDYIALDACLLIDTWRQLEAAADVGLTKHIGVSNFSEKKLRELLEKAANRPEVNQVELHPLLQQKKLFSFCQANNIILTAYSPLGSGDRHNSMKGSDEPNLFEIPEIKSIAEKHGISAAQVLIAWHVNRDCSVIPKSANPKNIKSNFQAGSIVLDADDMKLIAGLDRNKRIITGKFFEAPEKGYINVYDE